MKIILLCLIAYLLGAIPNGVWIGKLFFKTDIRNQGSQNIGTTNTFRVLGKKAGAAVFILDVLKGAIATALPLFFNLNISPLYFGLLAILGHTCSIFIRFKGGKAVATSAGMLIVYQPILCLILLAIFLITLYLTSMVSFASVTVCISAVILVFILPLLHTPFLSEFNWLFNFIVLGLASFIIYRHQGNLKRIRQKNENTVSFGLNLTKQKTFKKL
ncbi:MULTISPECIES: glycerol-3-phosphate 1-O-acyltransferase PlsY [unclassified Enterococcus]|uniref:glycerol-3-phosphate 1-O-acyltransferase PlsY n=1 Tax=unclassified Enterococcus TaxID=2608891 RepID=UPI001554F97E|nr:MULTISPECIES: glycerol-3-phosphate 1-O-acyltransferase PlsY [unclassified Enterococcus]MBS7576675.1 glycerol-3-phosphate 1-O-acyltransferase PlsY [Enterococcus sp. MMGLQ5-2]MBS7583838.1 glycerol-3-phosphate 1-O-acyltransferase PlsY [Enterococcus sp. MMGLQ5-1]NPD11699.1 glycerol-3-phosphate 1-O-acyltransferase PlsY [Enterococcus sp. MMGLQ5-1]NPD36512.1 glycerol-3-phosphate 1-O-acyltransferase PlsY [Enterococcus sp. MMGLQ5-2]